MLPASCAGAASEKPGGAPSVEVLAMVLGVPGSMVLCSVGAEHAWTPTSYLLAAGMALLLGAYGRPP